MCETVTNKIPGWKGWLDLPSPKMSGASGAWVDLSHRLTEELSRIPSFPQPRIRQIRRIPEHRSNVTEVHMVVHHGTHLGGVGLIICQWACHLGVRVIGTVSTPEKAELAKANGCGHPIIYTREDVVARMRELTNLLVADA